MELECFSEDDFALVLKRNIRALTVGKILFGQWSLYEKEMLKSEEERLKELQKRNSSTEEE
jgi:zeta toxin